MSGSNQAQPLNGLLGSLTGAFNQEDMGQGLMFAQNIRDYNAPVLDANDPNSLMDRQRWAQMNGYQKEAVEMGNALGKLNAANQLKEENAAKATNVANMFGNMIPSLPEGRQDEARSVRDALANEQITYKDALDWLQDGSSLNKNLHSGTWYKDGSYMGVDTKGNTFINTPDGQRLSQGDEGYEQAVKAGTASGIAYGYESARASSLGERHGSQVGDMGTTGASMYENAIEEVERITYAVSDNREIMDMLRSGEDINTGVLMGRIQKIFGGEAIGQFEVLQGNAAIDFLMNFKGPTTDFEFTKSEAAAFADLLRGEEINIGKLKQIEKALLRELGKQKRLASAGYQKMKAGLDSDAFNAEVAAYPVPEWMADFGISPEDPQSAETKGAGADLDEDGVVAPAQPSSNQKVDIDLSL